MSSKYEFRSVFAKYITDFLQMKTAQGVNIYNYLYYFKEFDIFFFDNNITDLNISQRVLSQWTETRVNDSKRTLYAKHAAFSQFCKYLCFLGIDCYIPRLPKRPTNDFVPYVFSFDEIERIFASIDSMYLKRRHMTSFLISAPALFRLLYSTGMRVGEAVNLKNEDVDFDKNIITLRKTKNKTDRIIPINMPLKTVLQEYVHYRNKMPINNIDSADHIFFVNGVGNAITTSGVHSRFKEVLKASNIVYIGNFKGHRVHDLRHTFAVHSLHQMVKNGFDIYCALPILSIFLGHKSVYNTEWYVRLTYDIFPEITDAQEELMTYIFPSLPNNR